MKIGNTTFKNNLGREMSFSKFTKQFEKLLKGATLEEAYILLGGKIKTKASK